MPGLAIQGPRCLKCRYLIWAAWNPAHGSSPLEILWTVWNAWPGHTNTYSRFLLGYMECQGWLNRCPFLLKHTVTEKKKSRLNT